MLGANVENLTLSMPASNTQTFDDMALGPIADGENGWKVLGPARDQAVVDLGGGNHAFHISSDPASGDFGGPYSPALSVAAGETGSFSLPESVDQVRLQGGQLDRRRIAARDRFRQCERHRSQQLPADRIDRQRACASR